MKIVTGEQMREIDRISIEEKRIPGLKLMEHAGESVVNEVLDRFSPTSVAVVTGKGNNAGDGFVVARLLAQKGIFTTVLMLATPQSLSRDAKTNFELLPPETVVIPVKHYDQLLKELAKHECVIDAILGTGIKGKVRGFYARAIEAINLTDTHIVAIDIPSGLPADGEPVEGTCVKAHLSVTMGLPKLGMVIHPGIEYTGKVVVADIGFPKSLIRDKKIQMNLINDRMVAEALPSRPSQGHKGTFGKLLIVAGSEGMTGAAVLCARAAMRSGVGLVYLCAAKKLNPSFESHLIEPITIPMEHSPDGFLSEDSLDEILRRSAQCDAVVIGPGLGQNPKTVSLVKKLLEQIGRPIILDADGLNAISDTPDLLLRVKRRIVLTPHPGEIARITNTTTKQVQSERIGIARQFAEKYGSVVALKGAQTIIGEPSGQCYINPTGNTGLAKGGSGDVLTGLIGGLRAQLEQVPTKGKNDEVDNRNALDSCLCGVYLHGSSADIASTDINTRAMIPSDVIQYIGKAFDALPGSK